MSIVNRRNAMLGWITWETGKRIAAHKARTAVQAEEGTSKKKKKKGVIFSLLAAAGAILVFWRHKASDEGPPGPE